MRDAQLDPLPLAIYFNFIYTTQPLPSTSHLSYLGGVAPWRTTTYSTCGTLVSHKESIQVIKAAGRKFTPELKAYTQTGAMPSYNAIRDKVINEYTAAGVPAKDVWVQSFEEPDIMYWIKNHKDFAKQAVYLDGQYGGEKIPRFAELAAAGVKILAPPLPILVQLGPNGYIPSEYAIKAKAAGFDLITWSLERDGPLATPGFYFSSTLTYTKYDGDMLELLHTLHKDIGVLGVFSDWPAVTTFYANCMHKEEPGLLERLTDSCA